MTCTHMHACTHARMHVHARARDLSLFLSLTQLEATNRVRIKTLQITLHKAKLPPWLYNVILQVPQKSPANSEKCPANSIRALPWQKNPANTKEPC